MTEWITGYCGVEPPHDLHQPSGDLRFVCIGFGPQHETERRARPARPDDLEALKARMERL